MNNIIESTVAFVQDRLKFAEPGHDWSHIQRVWNNTKLILETEQADRLVCELAALLHDIADSKFHDGDETIGPRVAGEFLATLDLDSETVDHVQKIIFNMSFKASLESTAFRSKEMEIVQDADRLDALGAIGIARAFSFGGNKNREMYNPEVPVREYKNKEEYKNSQAPTINHFYEKLLLLKDQMNTPTAKRLATHRHDYMISFLDEFLDEWNGKK